MDLWGRLCSDEGIAAVVSETEKTVLKDILRLYGRRRERRLWLVGNKTAREAKRNGHPYPVETKV
jgi:hypothetical protein